MPRIDKKLNLVIPIYTDDDTPKIKAYTHSQPISAEIFEIYQEPLALAYSMIFGGGYAALSGQRIAATLLRKAAKRLGVLDGEDGVEKGFFRELRRLTNVIVAGDNGWQSMMLFDAEKAGALDKEELQEVEAAIVFFIVVSAIMPKSERREAVTYAAGLWGAQVTLLTTTEFLNSCKTSTVTDSSGESPTSEASLPKS
jgi:hypothetical protein